MVAGSSPARPTIFLVFQWFVWLWQGLPEFLQIGQSSPNGQSGPNRGPGHPGRSGALPFAAIRHHNPAVGSVVAGTCRVDAAPPVLSALPCAAARSVRAALCRFVRSARSALCRAARCRSLRGGSKSFHHQNHRVARRFCCRQGLEAMADSAALPLRPAYPKGDAGANEHITCFRKPLQKLDRLSYLR